MTPDQYCQNKAAQSGSSFYYSFLFLPPQKRRAITALYAFCREVDDIADDAGATADKLARLAAWKQEIDNLYAGHPGYPTARALAAPVRDFDLPKAEFLMVIAGMEMDARAPIWGPSYADLFQYCRRVAGAVGILSIHAFGVTVPPAGDFAVSLGNALQLTNILRDVHEDALNGRLYLPRELLDKHGVAAATPEELLADAAVARVCGDLAEVAREAFAVSEDLLKHLDRRAMRPATLMMAVYRNILVRLSRRGWDRLDEAVRIPRFEKIAIVLRHGLF